MAKQKIYEVTKPIYGMARTRTHYKAHLKN